MTENKRKCCLCTAPIGEDAAILAMGGFGHPRCLCSVCEAEIDAVSRGKDYGEIAEAMNKIGKKLTDYAPDDLVLNSINEILKESAERAEKIKAGVYDFSLDDEEDGGDDAPSEIPEELLETEEDRLLDEKEAKDREKLDKFFNWITVGAIIGIIGFAVWMIIERLL